MRTRADYMANLCTFEEYYGEIVEEAGIRYRGDVSKIAAALKNGDEHLNSIGLSFWDAMGRDPVFRANVARVMRPRGDGPSLAGYVCILKTAAKMAEAAERQARDGIAFRDCQPIHNGGRGV